MRAEPASAIRPWLSFARVVGIFFHERLKLLRMSVHRGGDLANPRFGSVVTAPLLDTRMCLTCTEPGRSNSSLCAA